MMRPTMPGLSESLFFRPLLIGLVLLAIGCPPPPSLPGGPPPEYEPPRTYDLDGPKAPEPTPPEPVVQPAPPEPVVEPVPATTASAAPSVVPSASAAPSAAPSASASEDVKP